MDNPTLHSKEECILTQPSPKQDCFGWRGPIYEIWANCREYAQEYLASAHGVAGKKMYYAYNPEYRGIPNLDGHTNIARWFWTIEKKMGWTELTEVHQTQYDNVVLIRFADGWVQNPMAACLATLMMRIGIACSPEATIEQVLGWHEHSKKTKAAIFRFFDGYQHYTGNRRATTSNGWYAAFFKHSDEEIEKLLINRQQVEELAFKLSRQDGSKAEEDNWFAACEEFLVPDSHDMPPSGYLSQGSYHYEKDLKANRIAIMNDKSVKPAV